MKSEPSKSLVLKLSHIGKVIEVIARPESRDALRRELDELITALESLRAGLANPSLEARVTEVRGPLEQVVAFLELAKSDEVLRMLLPSWGGRPAKPKRHPIEIGSNLTNEQIRDLMGKELSISELKAIAEQRAISVGKLSAKEIRRAILRNLERQEGYGRLADS